MSEGVVEVGGGRSAQIKSAMHQQDHSHTFEGFEGGGGGWINDPIINADKLYY